MVVGRVNRHCLSTGIKCRVSFYVHRHKTERRTARISGALKLCCRKHPGIIILSRIDTGAVAEKNTTFCGLTYQPYLLIRRHMYVRSRLAKSSLMNDMTLFMFQKVAAYPNK